MKRLISWGWLCLLVGCSNSVDNTFAGAPLDCAWLESENCWKTLVADAQGCVPPTFETGLLSDDGTSCSYTSGETVEFRTPVVPPLDEKAYPPWHFTQSQSDEACVTFDSNADETSLTLTVQGQTFKRVVSGFAMQVTCPDGTQYQAQNSPDLQGCSNYAENTPGDSYVSSDISVGFALLTGHGDPGHAQALAVFDCGH
jgi:hypothetical protein